MGSPEQSAADQQTITQSLEATNVKSIPQLAKLWKIISPIMREIDSDHKDKGIPINAIAIGSYSRSMVFLDRKGDLWLYDFMQDVDLSKKINCRKAIVELRIDNGISGFESRILTSITTQVSEKLSCIAKKVGRLSNTMLSLAIHRQFS